MQPTAPETGKDTEKDTAKAPVNAASQDLQKKVEELEAQLKDKDAKYLYLYAEFENFKKRTIKERSDLMKFGWESQARELLQVIDNLERALAHMPASTDKTLTEGLHMVINQFKATLQKGGVERVAGIDSPFDPNLHEAVAQEPSEAPAGTILKEHQGGYTLHGRLLRPSRVVISSGK